MSVTKELKKEIISKLSKIDEYQDNLKEEIIKKWKEIGDKTFECFQFCENAAWRFWSKSWL